MNTLPTVRREDMPRYCQLSPQRTANTLLIAIMLGLAGCGGGSDDANDSDASPVAVVPPPAPITPPPAAVTPPPEPVTPPPTSTTPPLPPSTASLHIDPTLTAGVAKITSASGMAVPGEPISVPERAPALVIANNAAGAITALGSADANARTIVLSPVETARTFTWVQLGGPMLKISVAEAKQRISQSALFPQLVDAVRIAGQSPAGILQEPVYEQLAKVIADLRNPAPAVSTAGLVSAALTPQPRKDFLPKDLIGIVVTEVQARRPKQKTEHLRLANVGALRWRAESIPMIAGQTKPAFSVLLPPAGGFLGFFETTWLESGNNDTLLSLSQGDQFVRVFQNRETRVQNYVDIALAGSALVLNFMDDIVPFTPAQTSCILTTMGAATGLRPEGWADLHKNQLTDERLATFFKGYLNPTSVTGILGCMGVSKGKEQAQNFSALFLNILTSHPIFKYLDGASVASRLSTLALHHMEEDGVQMSVCVAKGTVATEECDVRSTFVVNVVQTGITVAPPSEFNITVDGIPQKIGIFCEASGDARGEQLITLTGLAATKRITARFRGEDLPTAGSYDFNTGDFDISHVTPRELIRSSPVVSFYDQQRYRIKGTVDLRTGRILGTLEETDVVSWTFNSMTKECTSSYSFEGGLAPGSN